MNTYYVDKKFLHELATPISVTSTALKMLVKDLDTILEPERKTKIFERLDRALRSVEKMEQLHADFKIAVEARKDL